MAKPSRRLGACLAALTQNGSAAWIPHDPVRFPHRYTAAADIEAAAFFSALLAYGRISAFGKVLERLLALMGEAPHRYLLSFDPARERPRFAGLYYRFNTEDDLFALTVLVSRVLQKDGSLAARFLRGYRPEEADIGPALARFAGSLQDESAATAPMTPGLRYLLPSPADGSACKRWNLFLRWMIRPRDGVDFGLWPAIPAAKLIIPLDTHIARIAGYLRLTGRKTSDWKTAREITAALKAIDPADPLRFDFPLCHLGISGACPIAPDPGACRLCPLLPACPRGRRLSRRRRRAI